MWLDPLFLLFLEWYAGDTGLAKNEFRILDWGCGRGRLVAALRARGYEVYGVDIDPAPIDSAQALFKKRGLAPDELLRVLDRSARCDFPDDFFDILLSWQVIEHIEDLDAVGAEMARVLKPGGFALNCFPAHLAVTEPHLFMPLVHWLPKNRIRYLGIRAMVALGIEPRWEELSDASATERARDYYRFSVDKTHYRSPRTIEETLARHGFASRFWSSPPPLFFFRRNRLLSRLWEWFFSNFRQIWMLNKLRSDEADRRMPWRAER